MGKIRGRQKHPLYEDGPSPKGKRRRVEQLGAGERRKRNGKELLYGHTTINDRDNQ